MILSKALAASLVLANGFLLVADVLHLRAGGPFSSKSWSGAHDGSYSELLGHAVLLVAAVLLAVVWRERRTAVYGVWALVLGTLVADDFLQLHERLGAVLVRTAGLPAVAGLRPADLGELLVWAVPTLVLGTALLITHVRARGIARQHSWLLIVLMVALAGFAVVLDMAYYMLDPWLSRRAGKAMTLAETTGELGVMTLLLIAVHVIATTTRPDDRRARHRRQSTFLKLVSTPVRPARHRA